MKAIVYSRFSPRRNEDKCESVEMQIEFCQAYCKTHQIEIVKVFSDKALSGSDEDRPNLWGAIDALEAGYLLIVYRLDRLARSVYLSDIIDRAVNKRKAKIRSISGEGTWSDSPEDGLIRNILHALAEYERKVISARTKAAMLRHIRNGRRMSHRLPYGWKADPNDDARMLPCAEERRIMAYCKILRDEGLSYRKITDRLYETKCYPRPIEKTFKGRKVVVKGKWHYGLIRAFLKRIEVDTP